MTAGQRLRLLSRPGCHLCEEMAQALAELGLAVDRVNVDEDPLLSAAYGDLVPVLMQGETEVARAPQSSRTLRRALHRSGVL